MSLGEQVAYQAGANAFRRGLSLTDNPLLSQSRVDSRAEAWHRGFLAAQREAEIDEQELAQDIFRGKP